jgi:hypothetical protein
MITKQTTQAQRTYRNGGTGQSWRKLAAGIGLAAGALLMAWALLVGRVAAPASVSLSSDTTVHPAAINHNVPIRRTWSAYDGQAGPARVVVSSSTQGWPGGTLIGSAYDGQTNASPRTNAMSSAQSWPGATLTGSAYDGQSAQAARVTARPAAHGWPGGTLMGSAYDGQTNHPMRLNVSSSAHGWPGGTLMGSAYNGQ